jgi:hypothetical protein
LSHIERRSQFEMGRSGADVFAVAEHEVQHNTVIEKIAHIFRSGARGSAVRVWFVLSPVIYRIEMRVEVPADVNGDFTIELDQNVADFRMPSGQ